MSKAGKRRATEVTVTAAGKPAEHLDESLRSASLLRRKGEEELARFFAHSADLLCIAGIDGYFKRLSSAWVSNLGWSLEEMTSRPFIEFVHPDDHNATLAEIVKLKRGSETVLFENRYRHKDGSYRWLQWNASADPGGLRIHATARDVTRRRQIEAEVLEIADREKESIGRDLHDGLCQTLAGISALSSRLSNRLAAISQATIADESAEITKLLRVAMGEARDLARGLSTGGLVQFGLGGALEALAHNVKRMFAIECWYECANVMPELPEEVEMHLFRIAQQAVQNAVEHGRAHQIEIALGAKATSGFMIVLDDGVGVASEAIKPEGMGMHTMRYRAGIIGGTLEVLPHVPRGTKVICEFGLPGCNETADMAR